MLVGYARVPTEDQTLDLQLDALQSAGCQQIFRDTASGAKADRPGLTRAVQADRLRHRRRHPDGYLPRTHAPGAGHRGADGSLELVAVLTRQAGER
jgi:Resolvase, N terminal domain